MGSIFEMRLKAQIDIKLPEFTHNRMVKWIVHVDETTDPTKTQYNLIIGWDLMHELNIIIVYRQQHIVWDDVAVSTNKKALFDGSHPWRDWLVCLSAAWDTEDRRMYYM